MNIFYLSDNPKKVVKQHCDQHVVKMILETAQMLSTAHHILDGPTNLIYKPTHKNHPCNVWVRSSNSNYLWATELLFDLLGEYYNRYGKSHKSEQIADILCFAPEHIPHGDWTEPPNCTPYKDYTDKIAAYQQFYRDKAIEWSTRTNKRPMYMKWTGRKIPEFMQDIPNIGNK